MNKLEMEITIACCLEIMELPRDYFVVKHLRRFGCMF